MATVLKFKFPVSLLVQESDYILNAADAHAGDVAPRLKAGFVDETRALYKRLKGKISGQTSAKADVGDLTQEQNDALQLAKDLVTKARDSAGLAFKGQAVKLRNEFQVGNNENGLGAFLQKARVIHAACLVPANAAALAENGWIADDTANLEEAIEKLDAADDVQEESKTKGSHSTTARNDDANSLFDSVLKIQNAANIKYPARNAANRPIRVEFRLGLFPPVRRGKSKQSPPSDPATPPPAQ